MGSSAIQEEVEEMDSVCACMYIGLFKFKQNKGSISLCRNLVRKICFFDKLNKKFWEELIAYFPCYHTDHIENDSSTILLLLRVYSLQL
jgi:hypothetical protein